MDINVDLLQWFIIFLIKTVRVVLKEIFQNEKLANRYVTDK